MPTSDKPTSASPGRLDRISIDLRSPAALYDDWLVAETEATLALSTWRAARPAAKPRAHGAYVAALAREARAAELLAERLNPA